MEGVLGIMLPIIISLGAFVMVVYLRKFENLERMAIIEKGLDPKLFRRDKTSNPSPVLRWALLLIGAGMGLIVGFFLEESFHHMDETAYFSMLMIFGGLGLLLAYIIEEKKTKNRVD